jgi:hypothetical protein
MAIILIGIDDTDNETSPGTGQLARRLMQELILRGAISRGITRHQFLVDDRIPYTSHNSGACLAIEWAGTIANLDISVELIRNWAAEGSDPGICISFLADVPRTAMDFGWTATREVLEMHQATELANTRKMFLHSLGGTGQGIIGALASVGLRADGNEGRFLDLPGLREIADDALESDLTALGIRIDHTDPMNTGQRPRRYKTMNWVRPRLVQGQPVWPVEWSDEHDAWISLDRKRSRPLE